MPRKEASPEMFDRMLDYYVRHSAWIMFRAVYWAIYLLFVGGILLYYNAMNLNVSLQMFFGLAFFVLALMVIIYGLTETLHNKLMKRYA